MTTAEQEVAVAEIRALIRNRPDLDLSSLAQDDAAGGIQAVLDRPEFAPLSVNARNLLAEGYVEEGGFYGLVNAVRTGLRADEQVAQETAVRWLNDNGIRADPNAPHPAAQVAALHAAAQVGGVSPLDMARQVGLADLTMAQQIEQQIAASAPREGDSPELARLKRDGDMSAILANPEAHRLAQEAYAARGITPPPGHTALSDYLLKERGLADAIAGGSLVNQSELRITGTKQQRAVERAVGNMSDEEQIGVAAHLHGLPQQQAKKSLSSAYASSLKDGVISRLAEKDAAGRSERARKAARGEIPSEGLSEQGKKWTAVDQGRRKPLENFRGWTETRAAAEQERGSLAAASRVAREAVEATPREGLSTRGVQNVTRHEAMSAAYDELAGESEESEEMEAVA